MRTARSSCAPGTIVISLLFILSIASIAEGVALRFPGVTILGFADDYRFLGPQQEAMDAAAEYRRLVIEAGHVDHASERA